jgi:hypothetical protein
VYEATQVYENTGNRKTTYILDPRPVLGHDELTMEELEKHIAIVEERLSVEKCIKKVNFTFPIIKLDRSDFYDVEPRNIIDHVQEGKIIRMWVKGTIMIEVSGLKEGERMVHWDESPLASNEHTNWCIMHTSIVKDGMIIADKTIGHS